MRPTILSEVTSRASPTALVTGGTGFVGKAAIRKLLELGFSLTALGRSPRPLWLDASVRYVEHDILQPIEFRDDFEFVIHAATSASATLNHESPLEMFNTCIEGMRNVISLCETMKSPPRVLFTSSGGVYGEMPSSLISFEERCGVAAPSFSVNSSYAEGKRAAEFLLADASHRGVCEGVVARLFSFSGTQLPLDRHFALGNFVRDATALQQITIRGDGTAIRSYMDEQDLGDWLSVILTKGATGALYHVGSERAISIRDVAHLVADRFAAITDVSCKIITMGHQSAIDGASRYLPNTMWTRSQLDLHETVALEVSIDSMLQSRLKTQNE